MKHLLHLLQDCYAMLCHVVDSPDTSEVVRNDAEELEKRVAVAIQDLLEKMNDAQDDT